MNDPTPRTSARFTSLFRSVLVGVLAMLASIAVITPAEAAHPGVACGAVLTRDTRLRADLVCAGNGLTLASGVRLDLGGHRLVGDSTGTGITITDTGPTSVVNGRIENWALGLYFESWVGDGSQVGLVLGRLHFVAAPLSLINADARLERSVLSDSALHIQSASLTATRSLLRRSSTKGELNRIALHRSRVIGGSVGVDENNDIEVVDTVLDAAGFDGYAIGCGGRTTVTRSIVRGYRVPLNAAGYCPLTVASSTFLDMSNGAITFEEGWPGSPSMGTVSDSTFRNSGVAISGSAVTVTGSTFVGNVAGVVLTDPTNSTITDSTFRRNAGSGIHADAAGLELGGNRAYGNGGYGIYAPGASDLGGNRAHGNRLGQCVGVVCSRS